MGNEYVKMRNEQPFLTYSIAVNPNWIIILVEYFYTAHVSDEVKCVIMYNKIIKPYVDRNIPFAV